MEAEDDKQFVCLQKTMSNTNLVPNQNICVENETSENEHTNAFKCLNRNKTVNTLRCRSRWTGTGNFAIVVILIYISFIQTVQCDGSYGSIKEWQRKQEDDMVVSQLPLTSPLT